MTEQSEAAVRDWVENDLELPFDAREYWDTLYAEADNVSIESDVEFDEAVRANKNSDKYVLVSTFLAAVLFFAGIATVLKSKSIRMVVLVGAATLLVGSSVYLVTLDRTF